MFQGSRSRLLGYYLIVMAAILIIFSGALYFLFSRSLYYNQLDTNLQTLARVAAPYYMEVRSKGQSFIDEHRQLPWRDFIDEEDQSIEWFDDNGQLIANQGNRIQLFFPPAEEGGFWTLKGKPALEDYQLRTFTLVLSIDRSELNLPDLKGYIRSSQSTVKVQNLQKEFLWQLGISIVAALIFVAVSSLWLTKKALEPVERSFKQLKQFTADASHELRSPLTAIKSSIDVMRRHPERFQAKDLKKLGAISSAADQMTHLTQDLLFLARTEGAKESLEGEWQLIPLHHLLQDLVDWLETVAMEKEIALTYEAQASIDLWCDRSQLSRLFSNLIENALQYTPAQGQVRVRLSRQNQNAIVSVQDSGIGIAPQDLKNVFDRFWRADQARLYRQGGTGLGLAISQAIAKRHGGYIEVTSELNKGSCFQVYLPLHYKESPERVKRNKLLRLQRSLQRFQKYSGVQLMKKIAVIALTLLLCIFPIVLVGEVFRQTRIFQGVEFPNGVNSFADRVIFPSSDNNISTRILGIPNSNEGGLLSFIFPSNSNLVLKQGESVIIKFSNNLLTGSGDAKPDLWVFTRGNPSTSLFVEVSKDPGIDLKQWQPVGKVNPANGGINIDDFGWGKNDFFSYVRLTNESLKGSDQPIPDIELDAVGAISSVNLISSSFVIEQLDNPLYWILGGIIILLFGFSGINWLSKRLQSIAFFNETKPKG